MKAPAARTEMSWRSALNDFLAHAAVTHPTICHNTPWLIALGFSHTSVRHLPKLVSLSCLVFGQSCVSYDLVQLMSFKDLTNGSRSLNPESLKSQSPILRSGRVQVNRWRSFSFFISQVPDLLRSLAYKRKTYLKTKYSLDPTIPDL